MPSLSCSKTVLMLLQHATCCCNMVLWHAARKLYLVTCLTASAGVVTCSMFQSVLQHAAYSMSVLQHLLMLQGNECRYHAACDKTNITMINQRPECERVRVCACAGTAVHHSVILNSISQIMRHQRCDMVQSHSLSLEACLLSVRGTGACDFRQN